jgi:hypothetical protein
MRRVADEEESSQRTAEMSSLRKAAPAVQLAESAGASPRDEPAASARYPEALGAYRRTMRAQNSAYSPTSIGGLV